VELSLRLEPAIERLRPGKHTVCVELVLQDNSLTGPSTSFHVVFEIGRDVLDFQQGFSFSEMALNDIYKRIVPCVRASEPSGAFFAFLRPRLDNVRCEA
jgi:hypothetical protein